MDVKNHHFLLVPAAAISAAAGAYFLRKHFVRSRRRNMTNDLGLDLEETNDPSLSSEASKNLGRTLGDLPDELILELCRRVHDSPVPESLRKSSDGDWARYDQGTRDIQNLRLTSRRFNRISSEFLIKFVRVDVSSQSLARLQEIMQHPGIGRGVGMVKIRLLKYDWMLSQFPEQYAGEVVLQLMEYKHLMGPEARLIAEKYIAALHAPWPKVPWKFAGPMLRGHQEYIRRYQEQKALPKAQFIKALAAALMMSKKRLRVEITDQDESRSLQWASLSGATKANFLDVVSVLQPSTGEELHWQNPDVPRSYASMIPRMLAAFSNHGVRIADLHLDITRTTWSDRAALKFTDLALIRKALQDVRKFSYTGHARIERGDFPELSTMLLNCLPPASLESLALRLVEFEPRCQFPKLSEITLHCVPVDARRLSILLQPLEPHTVAISLDNCGVPSDSSWADVLDLLRSKQRSARLYSPVGSEFREAWSNTDAHTLFDQPSHFEPLDRYIALCRKAEEYIRGRSDTNPFREASLSEAEDSHQTWSQG